MTTLTSGRLRPLLREIDERERELRRIVAEERERLEEDGFAQLGEPSADDADHAFARTQVSFENRMLGHHLSEIQELERARDRLGAGTFGICVDCGDEIGYERLKAEPAAERCMICQSRHERLALLAR